MNSSFSRNNIVTIKSFSILKYFFINFYWWQQLNRLVILYPLSAGIIINANRYLFSANYRQLSHFYCDSSLISASTKLQLYCISLKIPCIWPCWFLLFYMACCNFIVFCMSYLPFVYDNLYMHVLTHQCCLLYLQR